MAGGRKRALLVLGDALDFDSYLKFVRELKAGPAKRGVFECHFSTYDDALVQERGALPKLEGADSILVFLFFPFTFWDKHIETARYRGIYGNVEFYEKFRSFWTMINHKLKEHYEGKSLAFVNHPLRISTDRDKELTKEILSEKGIPVPATVFSRDVEKILSMLDAGKKLFVKVRYGSMGKGITYLERGRWLTNFGFKKGRIISLHSDHGWTFTNVTGDTRFLKELLSKDVVVEDAIEPLLIDGEKFDLRVYVCYGKVLYVYARTNHPSAVTTNISQGAKGETARFLKKIPKTALSKAKRNAIKTLKTLDLNFGGVDIMIDRKFKEAWVIEINAFPGFPKTKKFNLSRRVLQTIIREKKN